MSRHVHNVTLHFIVVTSVYWVVNGNILWHLQKKQEAISALVCIACDVMSRSTTRHAHKLCMSTEFNNQWRGVEFDLSKSSFATKFKKSRLNYYNNESTRCPHSARHYPTLDPIVRLCLLWLNNNNNNTPQTCGGNVMMCFLSLLYSKLQLTTWKYSLFEEWQKQRNFCGIFFCRRTNT